MRLSGKVAIVTGAAQGIGRAVAERFAADGAHVTLIDRQAMGSEVADAIARSGAGAWFAQGDVSRATDMRATVDGTVERFGRLDIVVNNAVVFARGTAVSVSEEDWDRAMAVNLKGAFLSAKSAIPHMERGGGGVIINMSALAGIFAREDYVAYATSKGGLLALTRAIAIDHARQNIRAVAICPGLISNQLDSVAKDFDDPEAGRRAAIDSHPLGRVADPEELAGFVSFLASDEASYITGATYVFDAGYTAGARVGTVALSEQRSARR
jgi:NAD(P)-dependent dehydrogenase (short-subunit alcohol dehydrogenase family)